MTAPETLPSYFETDWLDDEEVVCSECNGECTVLVCVDDLCHGQGWCMHGDGEIDCPHCNGTGLEP